MRPWLVAVVTVGFDQLTKWLVRTSLSTTQSVPILPGILHLTYVHNTGAAFSVLQGQAKALTVFSVVIAVWLIKELRRQPLPHQRGSTPWALALILGGTLGNLIDRLWFGHVIDFIDVRVWPVFNVADSAITIGVTWLIWKALIRGNQR